MSAVEEPPSSVAIPPSGEAPPAVPEEARCPNCAEVAPGKFCAECGQEQVSVVAPIGDLLRDVTEEFLKFDSRLFRTLGALLFRPGLLTLEFLSGRRMRYVAPFKLYFALATFWLLTYTFSGLAAQIEAMEPVPTPPRAGASPEEAALHREQLAMRQTLHWFSANHNTVFFVTLPVAALVLTAMYRRSGRLYIEHLVFSVHVGSLGFLNWTVTVWVETLLQRSLKGRAPPHLSDWVDGITMLLEVLYLFLAMRRVYGEPMRRTLGRTALLLASYLLMVMVTLAVVYTLHHERVLR